MRKRIQYGQNFIKDTGLITKLISNSAITSADTVIDIGAGNGAITNELLKKGAYVIAYEIDPNLSRKLVNRFQYKNNPLRHSELALPFRSPTITGQRRVSASTHSNIIIIHADFLKSELPKSPYKIFSNIPFSITADVIKKLTLSDNPPLDSYLIVQQEAAKKFIGMPFAKTNSQITILLYPWFDLTVFYAFSRNDFYPRPAVDVVMIRICKRLQSFIRNINQTLYFDFVTYAYNKSLYNKPSLLPQDSWITLLNSDVLGNKQMNTKINGCFKRQLKEQEKLIKSHRFRGAFF